MLVDLHVVAPPAGVGQEWANLIRACKGVGLDGVCLVAEGSLPALEDAKAIARDIALFVGALFPVGRGRLILVPARLEGFSETLRGRSVTTYEEALALAEDTDAAVIAVHPYDRSAGTSFSDTIFQLEGLDAVEVANATRSEVANRLALEAALRLHLAPVGGTGPATSPGTVGRAATAFARPVVDQAALVEAIRSGEVFPVEMSRRGGGGRPAERPRRPGHSRPSDSGEGGT